MRLIDFWVIMLDFFFCFFFFFFFFFFLKKCIYIYMNYG